MSIQTEGETLQIIAGLLEKARDGQTENGTLDEVVNETIKDLRSIGARLCNPRGDYIEYEHDNGSDKITLCGIPIRGVQKLIWIKHARGRPQVNFEATVRARIHDVTTR